MTKNDIQAQALALMKSEISRYSDGFCWVTKTKAINLRYIWDIVRENYYGIFKQPKDRFNQDKIPYPLTESLVWENVKNLDLDTKDINVKAANPKSAEKSLAVRYIIKDWLYKNCFGEKLNKWIMHYVLDGHLVVKKIKNGNNIDLKMVDLRNCFYDYHTDDIQKTPFIERGIQDLTELKANNPDWINLDKVSGRKDLPANYDENKEAEGSVPELDMYERWGKIPLSWITGYKKDENTWKEGIIWASDVLGNGQIHKIMLNNDELKPFEDVAFEDAPNRHPGRGVGEKLMFLQIYLNTLYNIRRNNNLVMLNQLFKFRAGAGITPEKISGLVAGGAIEVQQMDDIDRIDTQNINFGESLNEEQNLVQVASRVTSTQEAASGENLPASTPATNAIIQNQAVKTSHELRQERFGLFLERLFKRQITPELKNMYKKGDYVRIDKDDKFNETKRRIAIKRAKQYAEETGENNQAEIDNMVSQQDEYLGRANDLFLEVEDMKFTDYDVQFFVTGEQFDKNTILQNLQMVLGNYSQYAADPNSQKVLREIYDLLGLDSNNLMPDQSFMPAGQPQEMPGQPQEGVPTQSDLVTSQTNRVANQANNL